MAHFRPCSNCSRHVRTDETRCPFCAADLERALPQPVPDVRLGRAAIMAVSTALAAGSISGCGDDKGPPDPVTAVPPYGVTAPVPAYGATADPNQPQPQPQPPPDPYPAVPPYGVTAPPYNAVPAYGVTADPLRPKPVPKGSAPGSTTKGPPKPVPGGDKF